jgi:hypothetical protein
MDESQRKINEMCGVSDEAFAKYSEGTPSADTVEHIIAGDHYSIDEDQRRINQICGVSDAVFLKYNNSSYINNPLSACRVRKALDIAREAEMVLAKYNARPKQQPGTIDEGQRRINEMCGVSDEIFLKYNKQKGE